MADEVPKEGAPDASLGFGCADDRDIARGKNGVERMASEDGLPASSSCKGGYSVLIEKDGDYDKFRQEAGPSM
jgi:hypothetical protein